MTAPDGEHLGLRHLDRRHDGGDWTHDRDHHPTPTTDPADVDGYPLGRAAHHAAGGHPMNHPSPGRRAHTLRTLRTLAGIAATITALVVLVEVGARLGWWLA